MKINAKNCLRYFLIVTIVFVISDYFFSTKIDFLKIAFINIFGCIGIMLFSNKTTLTFDDASKKLIILKKHVLGDYSKYEYSYENLLFKIENKKKLLSKETSLTISNQSKDIFKIKNLNLLNNSAELIKRLNEKSFNFVNS